MLPGYSSTPQTEPSTQDRQPQPPNEPPRPRLPPRRATQACLVCRQRRVRCDVSFKEGDCTNCMLDRLECIVVSSKRRARRNPNEKTPASSSSNQSRAGNESPRSLEQDGIQTSRVRRENDLVIRYTERTYLDSYRDPTLETSQNHRSEARLPGYIKSFDVQRSEDLEFLQQRAVFELLPLELAHIVLARYEELVYPVLPILDVADFRSAILGKSGYETSLLLYHAVMVMGLNCTESEAVLQLSHTTKGELRSASYEKAKVLFDIGVEQDSMVLCQACLLLADRDFYTDVKDASYWVGNAILHANILGLYRAIETTPGSWNTTKVLWWCVVIKECDVSTYVNYAPRVSPFTSPMLALSDFGIEDDVNMDSGKENSPLDSPAAKLAAIYIIRAKRSCQVYLVKRQMYEEVQPWNGQTRKSTQRAMRQEMLSQLHSWESDTPHELRSETLQPEFDSSLVGVTCASAMAEIVYWSAYFFIYMPDVRFHVQYTKGIEVVVDPEGRPVLRHAASQIVTVFERLLALNMGQSFTASHGWHLGVAAFALLQDTQAIDPVIRDNSLRKMEVCHRAAHALTETYPILSQVTLGFKPAEWQPHGPQPRTETPASNHPTDGDNERGPGWQPPDEATEQTYAMNSRLHSRHAEKHGCQVNDVLGWVSLG